MRRRALVTCLIFASLSAFLLATAAPSLIAAVARLPGNPTADALAESRRVMPAELDGLVASNLAARRFLAKPAYLMDVSAALLREAVTEPAGSARRATLLDQATAALRQGLSEQPANGFGWARLAEALALARSDPAAPLPAWRMSVDVAPAEPRLVAWRARFGATRIGLLDDADRRRLLQQITMARRFGSVGFRAP